MLKKLLGFIVGVALVLAAGGVFYKTLIVGSTEPPPPIETRAVVTVDIDESITCLGAVEPELFSDIKSEVSGRIEVVHVVSGSEVTKGDPLVELDRSELESEVKELEFAIESSRLKMEKVKLDFDSKRELAAKEFVSLRELADAEIDFKLSENDLNIQKAKLETLNEKLAKTVIRAPHDGVVLGNAVLEGMVITGATSFSEGTLLMQVAQLNRLRVNTDVNEIDVAKLVPNMEVALTFESLPEVVIDGRIVFVSPSAESEAGRSGESAARVFPIIVAFETDNPRIRPGMSAQVEVVLSSAQNVLAVALPALFMEEGETVVYVKRAEGMFDRREVKVGISDTDVIEIKDGLEEGEELALSKPELEGAGSAESSG
ncbi:MAG: efflux RND transporter periplasmic adaptor subunit [Verrucomicrobiales bacterium]|nr:efflux RND transporter periplasmic adaptor subunit [Verrucomicrobiales bacterium]